MKKIKSWLTIILSIIAIYALLKSLLGNKDKKYTNIQDIN